MCSPEINGEGKLRGQLANPGSPGKRLLKWSVCVCVILLQYFDTVSWVTCKKLSVGMLLVVTV